MDEQIETFEQLPMISEERFAQLEEWANSKDRRYYDVWGPYFHKNKTVYAVALWAARIEKEVHRKVYAIVFSDLPEEEKERRLEIIWKHSILTSR